MLDISIVIPVYNGADFIAANLERLRAYMTGLGNSFEIIAVNDGSTDETRAVLDNLKIPELRILHQAKNGGKWTALIAGMAATKGRCCMFTDADLPYELEAIPYAADLIIRREIHIVVGDRQLKTSSYRVHMNWLRKAATLSFSLFVRMLVTGGLFDTQCGFKAFRSDVAHALFPMLKSEGFSGDVELLWIALSYNLEIKRIPVRLQQVGTSTVNVLVHGISMLFRISTLRRNWFRGAYRSEVLERIATQDYVSRFSAGGNVGREQAR